MRHKALFTTLIVLFFLVVTGTGALFAIFGREYFPFLPAIASSAESGPASSDKPPKDTREDISQASSEEPSRTSSLDESAEKDAGSEGESASLQEKNDAGQQEPKEQAQSTEEEPPPQFNKPDEMRAVFLHPGRDYPVTGGAAAIEAGMDKALADAKSVMMNTVVLSLYDESNKAIYQTGESTLSASEIDILKTLVGKAHSQGMYVYLLYSASVKNQAGNALPQSSVDAALTDFSSQNAGALAEAYQPDGILIDSYYNETQPDSYSQYIRSGEGIGYAEYMRQKSEALYRATRDGIKNAARNTQVGLVADSVWQNAAQNEAGSNTTASFTALGSGNADTKQFVEEGLADFIAVYSNGAIENKEEPFKEVVSWWSRLAAADSLPFYVIQASEKICTDAPGYASPDELVQELLYAKECANFEGSIFTNLPRLVENPQESTDLLLKLFTDQINVEHVLTRLAVTNPEEGEFSTMEPVMVFRGASDPNFDVTLDGETLETDENGYFTASKDLKAGVNEFTFSHKNQTQSFKITRNVQIIKEISPQGSLSLDGGMQLQITALAYSDAKLSAAVGGIAVPMQRDDSVSDDTDDDSAYSRFVGSCTLPAAAGEAQVLGSVVVMGQWQGVSEQKQGATVTINPVTPAGDGALVVVTADSAKTFPTNVLNNESNPACYPLPRGTMDYMVGEELQFTNASGSYRYYTLQSGLRVYVDDVKKSAGSLTTNNVISSMSVTSDSKYTYLALDTKQPVPYLVSYQGDGLTFNFQYTTKTPESQQISGNPALSAAVWSGSSLTLSFAKAGSHLGYYAYYKDGKLILRLTNPPNSLRGVRVAIDPGHGGKDSGATGYYPDMNEAQINAAIAEKTADALSNKGATVKLIDTDPYLTLNERLAAAHAFDADVYVSVHCNSSRNAAATGSEVYYFYQNGQSLASAASKRVASALESENRGAKQASYWVTADSRFAAILVECGFVSNKSEYKKLVKSSYQTKIADDIAQAVEDYIGSLSTGLAGGNDSTFSAEGRDTSIPEEYWEDEEDEEKSTSEDDIYIEQDSSSESAEDDFWVDESDDDDALSLFDEDAALSFTRQRVTLEEGDSYQLGIEFTPSSLEREVILLFRSEDSDIAAVDSDGFITAIGSGSVDITVYAKEDRSLSARIKVTVS